MKGVGDIDLSKVCEVIIIIHIQKVTSPDIQSLDLNTRKKFYPVGWMESSTSAVVVCWPQPKARGNKQCKGHHLPRSTGSCVPLGPSWHILNQIRVSYLVLGHRAKPYRGTKMFVHVSFFHKTWFILPGHNRATIKRSIGYFLNCWYVYVV